jgi:cysteine desulfurase/selenocysteine lyase
MHALTERKGAVLLEGAKENKMDAEYSQSHEPLTITRMRENIIGVDVQVPLINGSTRTYTNFDNAASTPALRPVFDKVNEFMSWYSSVHRGTGFKSQISTQVYDEAHEIVLEFVGADHDSNVVIFGKNSTEALNKIAHRYPFKSGDVVLTTLMEHHSNDLPWRSVAQVKHIGLDERGALDLDHLGALLKQNSGRVRLVVLTAASNVTGIINPIHEIAERVHAAGAEIVVDCAQFAAHRAVNMRPDDDPGHLDYVVISAHKMYAPYGTGALIGNKDIFLQGDPDLVGGGTIDYVTVDDVLWAGLPDKEEAGSPNVVGGMALAQTILCLQEVGMDAIAKHEASLTSTLLKKLTAIDKIKIYGSADPDHTLERVGVVTFAAENLSHYLVASILSFEGGIGVRNGCFCAHPYLYKLLNLTDDQAKQYQRALFKGRRENLPGLVRVSFGCYNNEDEVDWFVEMMERIVQGRYDGKYTQDPTSGEYRPDGYQVNTMSYYSFR